jgi:hypothetical protein
MASTGERVDVTAIGTAAEKLLTNIGKVIVGKRDAIKLVLVALFTEGHLSLLRTCPASARRCWQKALARFPRWCSFQAHPVHA